LAAASLSLAYGFLGEEILEFDSEKTNHRQGNTRLGNESANILSSSAVTWSVAKEERAVHI
jgi:hypothetical protein